jgi:transcriptional regulator with XRE-family HTH domain
VKNDSTSSEAEAANRPHRSLGRRIANQRRAVFLTQEALAGRLGITQSAVARWETGECEPALRHRMRLAEELLISPHILFAVEVAA